MKPIPVIDLLSGHVVHARCGDRARYAPLCSPWCPNADPLALAQRFVEELGADTLYLADLDAIAGREPHRALIEQLVHRLPGITLWLDAGTRNAAELERLRAIVGTRPVLGSESLSDANLPTRPEAAGAILSLDFKNGRLLGPACLEDSPALWPDAVILMELSRVGSESGPDLARLEAYRQRNPRVDWYAAGGVRHRADLMALQASGAAGVLLASALHSGRITAADLGTRRGSLGTA